MKRTFTAILAALLLLTTLCIGLLECRKTSSNEATELTTTVETASVESIGAVTEQSSVESTTPETTEAMQETWEVKVLESTPNKIVSEITNQKGETIQNSIGVERGEEAAEKVPDDAGNVPSQIQPKPTEPKPTEPKPTEPKPTEPKPVQPSGSVTKVDEPGSDVTFEDYESMSGEEQLLFYYTFADANAFNAWYADAKAVYEENREEIIIGTDGVVDLS